MTPEPASKPPSLKDEATISQRIEQAIAWLDKADSYDESWHSKSIREAKTILREQVKRLEAQSDDRLKALREKVESFRDSLRQENDKIIVRCVLTMFPAEIDSMEAESPTGTNDTAEEEEKRD